MLCRNVAAALVPSLSLSPVFGVRWEARHFGQVGMRVKLKPRNNLFHWRRGLVIGAVTGKASLRRCLGLALALAGGVCVSFILNTKIYVLTIH